MSLGRRLDELSPDLNSNKIEVLRNELEGSSAYTNGSRSYASNQYLALSKPAALTGSLHVRYQICLFWISRVFSDLLQYVFL